MSTCRTGKIQYATRAAAKAARRALNWRGRGDKTLECYRCGDCGSYHLGRLFDTRKVQR